MSKYINSLKLLSRTYNRTLAQNPPTRSIYLTSPVEQQNDDDKSSKVDPTKDRSTIIPVDTSIKYMQSKAYKETYGVNPVWTEYRRNHKGVFAPKRTRKTCIRQGAISTGNPCPICRDEYLVLDHRNHELLKQFVSPHTGEVLSYTKTGICQKRHQELLVAVERAKDVGVLTFDVPFRVYNYEQYKPKPTMN